MGEKADLNWADSIEKIRHIAEGEIAMMHTFNDGLKVGVVRPMATAGVDADGTLWFLSQAHSPKNEHLAADEVMQVTYSLKSRSEYLVLDGRGSVLRDQAKLDELWKAIDKTWFPEGKDDPRITLIRFVPEIGHYWDTKHSKMVQLLGMAVGAVTGKPTDDSVEGDLQP
jgi:general stress protein 26